MVLVREIMTPHVVTLAPAATLREAVDMLTTCRIGGAPVVDGRIIVGVLSAPDIVRFESEHHDGGLERDSDDELPIEPAQEWSDGEEAPGRFFTDLWTAGHPPGRIEFNGVCGWDLLEDHTVSEVMSRSVCTLPESLELSAAAQRMLEAGVQRALVTCNGMLVGILTATDILRAVAGRRLGEGALAPA